jgi:hypothetical protein
MEAHQTRMVKKRAEKRRKRCLERERQRRWRLRAKTARASKARRGSHGRLE